MALDPQTTMVLILLGIRELDQLGAHWITAWRGNKSEPGDTQALNDTIQQFGQLLYRASPTQPAPARPAMGIIPAPMQYAGSAGIAPTLQAK